MMVTPQRGGANNDDEDGGGARSAGVMQEGIVQRTREELEQMSHDELATRVLEMQDMLREGLAVRDVLHKVLNNLLKAKAEEVEYYASLETDHLPPEEQAVRDAWAKARHAASNPSGLAWLLTKVES